MSTNEIKQSTIDIFLGLLKGAYALPAIMIFIIWLWVRLTPEQIAKIQELEPLMNSSIGVAFSFVVVMSFVFSLVLRVKEEIRSLFTIPMREMLIAIVDVKTEVKMVKEEVESITDEVKAIKPFFNGHGA